MKQKTHPCFSLSPSQLPFWPFSRELFYSLMNVCKKKKKEIVFSLDCKLMTFL